MPAKNLRSIDNIDTNDMNFKHLETTKDIVISPKNEYGDPQRPDATHKWSAKVSDGTNYVGNYAVKINGASLIVDSEDFTKLPVGNYTLEVWEQWNDPDGTKELSIYPSPQKTIPFTIYANITDQAEKEIKRIGFQDVVDQAVMNIGMNYVFKVNTVEPDQTATVVQTAADGKNYVTFNIPQGKTGDRGFRGPDGKAFHIEKTFPSVKEMNDSQGKDFEDGDFALISNNVNDPDNAKLYVWDGKQFNFATDMSGAQGIQGPAGPAATIHVTKTYTVPAGQPPVFKAIPKGDGNFDIEVGLPQGVAGKDGHSVWGNVTNHDPNEAGCWFTDLANASASNPPKVNDIMINAGGNMAMITKVNITNNPSTGGGTFDYGSWVGNIKGSKGDKGDPGKDGYTPVRGTDYWTNDDKQSIYNETKKYVEDAILNGKW